MCHFAKDEVAVMPFLGCYLESFNAERLPWDRHLTPFSPVSYRIGPPPFSLDLRPTLLDFKYV